MNKEQLSSYIPELTFYSQYQKYPYGFSVGGVI